MRKDRTKRLKRAAAALAACLLALCSAGAGAEERETAEWLKVYDLPEYKPVELKNKTPDPIPPDQDTPYEPHLNGYLPDYGGYVDDTISVRVETREIQNTKVLFTWVQIADPTQLRTAYEGNYPYLKNLYASDLARANRAVLAVSGDWFTMRKNKEGVVIRNGRMLRNRDCGAYDGLIIDTKGDFHILRQGTKEQFAEYEGQIMHSFVFGPALVVDGELMQHDMFGETPSYWLIKNVGGGKKTQRSAICQMGPLSYLLITTEGPEQSRDGGFTIPELGDLAYAMGAQNAFNLDGGSSAWLVLGGERINTMKTRNIQKISDIIYFATAEPEQPSVAPAPAADTAP